LTNGGVVKKNQVHRAKLKEKRSFAVLE
jgi:hypothetical protein